MFNPSTDITRTIYSIGWPNTVKIYEKYLKVNNSEMFNNTWTKKQDSMHKEYLSLWKDANSSHINFLDTQLPYSYPTNGSSEAIFMQLTYLNSIGKRLVNFVEEYEGYSAFANNISMPVHFVNRDDIDWSSIDADKDVFFLSQPASCDGNYWEGFQDFMVKAESMNVPVYVDLAYLGTFKHPMIELQNFKNLDGVFFSLSKIFGVYYHRLGGVFLKKENPILWPMLWFKNLNAMAYGKMLLEEKNNGDFNEDIELAKETQKTICKELTKETGIEFLPSGVPMIATVKYEPEKYEWMKPLVRSNNPERVRVCISKLLETRLFPERA